jgi:diacylglycerol kinase family enzyme
MSALPTHPDGRRLAPGAPFFVILNVGAGADDARERMAAVTGVLGAAAHPFEVLPVTDPQRLPAIAAQAVAMARAQGGAVIAAGGDGTINTIAQQVLPSGLPLGILPQGTFNYVARAHGIPTDLAEALRALLTAHLQDVSVGQVNERIFLVNASIGLYPQLIADREAFTRRFGRSRATALWAALHSVIREHRQNELVVELQETQRVLRTTTLMVGNNALQLRRLGLPEADAIADGQLAAVIVRPVGTLAMLGLLLRGAAGQLGDALAVDSFAFTRLTVQPWRSRYAFGGRTVKVAIDGEVERLMPPLCFARASRALNLLVPDPAHAVPVA